MKKADYQKKQTSPNSCCRRLDGSRGRLKTEEGGWGDAKDVERSVGSFSTDDVTTQTEPFDLDSFNNNHLVSTSVQVTTGRGRRPWRYALHSLQALLLFLLVCQYYSAITPFCRSVWERGLARTLSGLLLQRKLPERAETNKLYQLAEKVYHLISNTLYALKFWE